MKKLRDLLSRNWDLLAGLFVVGAFCVHFLYIQMYSVNVPFWDEWELFSNGALGPNFSLKWILTPHNEHIHSFTKIIFWLSYKLDNLNLIHLVYLNYIFYLIMVLLVYLVFRNPFREHKGLLLGTVLLFASRNAHENLGWPWEIHYHLVLIFSLSSIVLNSLVKNSWVRAIGTGLLPGLSIFNLSLGVPIAFVVFTFSLYQNLQKNREESIRNRWVLSLSSISIFLMLFLFWRTILGELPENILTMPWEMNYWKYFLTLVGRAFGFEELGLVQTVGAIVVGTLGWGFILYLMKLMRGDLRAPEPRWQAIALSILLALAAVAVGRAHMGLEQALASRYSEIAMLLLPCFWLALIEVMRTHWPKANRRLILRLSYGVVFLAFFDNWNFNAHRMNSDQKKAGVDCIKNYYLIGGNTVCETLYPLDIGEKLIRMKELNVSSMKSILEQEER